MSPVQAGGGKQSGQKSGTAAGGRPASGTKPTSGARGANGAGKPAPGRPGPATKTGAKGGRGGKGNAPRTSGYKPGARPPQRFSPSTLAFAAVAVVVVIIVAFVIVKVTSKPSTTAPAGTSAPTVTPAPASLVNEVTSVPTSVATAVGLPPTGTVVPPTVKTGQPRLTISGKPGVVFVGAEFCPYCAAERWPMIMALSKFGTFSNLSETTSSPWDTDPSTPTFTFRGATYTSQYITFSPSEHTSNDTGPNLAGRVTLEPLTKVQSSLWAKYDNPEGFPFLDIGNKSFVLSPSYLPTTLSGLDQADVAAKLKNPKDPVTVAIVGTANYLTAGICAITGQQPASACSPPIVARAAHGMGLS